MPAAVCCCCRGWLAGWLAAAVWLAAVPSALPWLAAAVVAGCCRLPSGWLLSLPLLLSLLPFLPSGWAGSLLGGADPRGSGAVWLAGFEARGRTLLPSGWAGCLSSAAAAVSGWWLLSIGADRCRLLPLP